MTVRVLDEQQVLQLLPMDECIAAMEHALASLGRDEVYNPLRFVLRPPDDPSLTRSSATGLARRASAVAVFDPPSPTDTRTSP